jgi:hypothetical protein
VPCLIWHRPDLFEICFEQPRFIENPSLKWANYPGYQREAEPWIELRGQLVAIPTGTQIELFVKTHVLPEQIIFIPFLLFFFLPICFILLANQITAGFVLAIGLAILLPFLVHRDWFRREVKKQVQFVKELLEVHSEGKWVDDPYIERFFVPVGSYRHQVYEQAAVLNQQKISEIAQTYAVLGEEIGPKTCQVSRCDHLTIAHSYFCRVHHMEMLYGAEGVAYWQQQQLQAKLDS